MVRGGIWLIVVLAAVWTGWWWLASAGLGQLLQQDRIAVSGWEVEPGAAKVSRYPTRFDVEVDRLSARGPNGSRLTMGNLKASAPAYLPTDLTLVLPENPVVMTLPGAEATLTAKGGIAELRLSPRRALDLQEFGFRSETLEIGLNGQEFGASGPIHANLQQSDKIPASYDLILKADALRWEEAFSRYLDIPTELRDAAASVDLAALLTLDEPLSAATVNAGSVQLRALRGLRAEATWGGVTLRAEGDLTFDSSGRPEGTLTARVNDWRPVLSLATTAGWLAPEMRTQAETILTALGRMNGDENTLELPLRFGDGQMWLGGMALGPAPAIPIR